MTYRKLKTHDVVLKCPRATLRPLIESDWDLLMKWNNDPDVFKLSEGDDRCSWELRELQDMYRGVSRFAMMFIIEIKAGGKERGRFPGNRKPIGDVWLQEMNIRHWQENYPGADLRRIPIFIGEKGEWGKGYGTEIIQALAEYAFADGADMVFACSVMDYNVRGLKAFEKSGFKVIRKIKLKKGMKGKWAFDLVRRK